MLHAYSNLTRRLKNWLDFLNKISPFEERNIFFQTLRVAYDSRGDIVVYPEESTVAGTG